MSEEALVKRQYWIGVLLVAAMVCCTQAIASPIPWNAKEFMGVNEIHPGMVGYGKTVFQGTRIDTFNIKVIGVLKKVDFGFDMILIKVTSGPVVTRNLQTVAGMSGSPIYINNRLIGAYAYGWDFQKEPIAGVTPIAAMLDCVQPNASSSPRVTGSLVPADRVMRIGNHVIDNVRVAENHAAGQTLQAKSDPTTMVLTPAATPLFVNGFSASALDPLQKFFDRYNLRAMVGPGEMPGPATRLQPGSAVAVSLMEGDANVSAVGTVTYVKGNTILAFGHPFFGLGKVNMPMSTAYVQDIINSAQSSFKLASPVAEVGTLTSDRQFAVGGTLGPKADTIPVALQVSDPSRNYTRHYAVRVTSNPAFTPSLLYMYVLFGGSSQLADMSTSPGTFTAHTTLSTDTQGNLEQNMSFVQTGHLPDLDEEHRGHASGASFAGQAPMSDFYLLADALMQNPYSPVKITKASVSLTYQPELKMATIEQVIPDRTIVRPGECVNLTVFIRPYGKPVEKKVITVKVPENTTETDVIIAVAGGADEKYLKPLLMPFPSPDEGIHGIVRWLSSSASAQSLLTLSLYPSMSYGYRGHQFNDVSLPLAQLLQFDTTRGIAQVSLPSEATLNGQESIFDLEHPNELRPASYHKTQDMPYTLTGAKLVIIGVDLPDGHSISQTSGYNATQTGILSATILPGGARGPAAAGDSGSTDNSGDNNSADTGNDQTAYWYTPAQRAQFARLTADAFPGLAPPVRLAMPTFKFPSLGSGEPLSYFLAQNTPGGGIMPAADDDKLPTAKDIVKTVQPKSAADKEKVAQKDSADSAAGEPAGSALLTHKRPSWGLTKLTDFLSGTNVGTTITSHGNLTLMPNVRALYRTDTMEPWRLVATSHGTYIAGLNTNRVIRVQGDGKGEVIFPKKPADAGTAETVLALATEANGNLLVGSWPDHTIRQITPDGAVLRTWILPVETIWDILVASDGKRYVAGGDGTLYLLRDDPQAPWQVACTIPDKSIYTMTAGAQGDVYFASYPHGKIYKLSAHGTLSSIYQFNNSTVTSLAADDKGDLYVGMAPTCVVVRIAPDSSKSEIFASPTATSQSVTALKLLGNTLYAATGPSGGIYRIADPTSEDPEITVVYAREDMRNAFEAAPITAPESIMVTSLAASPQGDLLAAAAVPGQIFTLEPRQHGAFTSQVLPTPAVSHWGQVEMHVKHSDLGYATDPAHASLLVETRSGGTARPDSTWSAWSALSNDALITSPAASFAQIRVSLTETPDDHLSLDYIRGYYLPENQAPDVTLQDLKPDQFMHGKESIKWTGKDPDGDDLVYTAFYSKDGMNWTPIVTKTKDEKKADTKKLDTASADKKTDDKSADTPADHPDAKATSKPSDKSPDDANSAKDATKPAEKSDAPTADASTDEAATDAAKPADKSDADSAKDAAPDVPLPAIRENLETSKTTFVWDTKTVSDGEYILKIVGSDKYAHPTDPKSSESISDRCIIDNTPPTISLADKVYGWDNAKRFIVTDNLTPIVGGKYRIDEGPWMALVPEDGIFDSTKEAVLLLSPDGPINLTDGEHKLQIVVQDSAENQLDHTVTVVIGKAADTTVKP
jgi:hypothetical protein